MKRMFVLLSIPIFMASCASSSSQSAKVESDQPAKVAERQSTPTRTQPSAQIDTAKPEVASVKNTTPTSSIPDGARFTITCKIFAGGDHVVRATQLRDALMRSSGMNGWYVVHEDETDRSVIRYGYYKEINPSNAQDSSAKRDAERASSDMKRIGQIQDETGRQMFSPLPEPLDLPDPESPPEWNLVNCPKEWSLQIAAYTGGPERKKAAVDSVRDARAMGIEAYYFHGANVSSVCIGSWNADAVEVIGAEGKPQRDLVGDTLIISTIPLGNDAPQSTYTKNGNITTIVQTTVRIKDESLKAIAQEYPDHSTNGAQDLMQVRDKATGKMVMRSKPSLLVKIPHEVVLPENYGETQSTDLIQQNNQRDITEKLRRVNE